MAANSRVVCRTFFILANRCLRYESGSNFRGLASVTNCTPSKHQDVSKNLTQNRTKAEAQTSAILKFKCPHCEMTSSSKSDLKHHVVTDHKSPPYVCPYCCEGFNNFAMLNKHIKLQHAGKSSLKEPFEVVEIGTLKIETEKKPKKPTEAKSIRNATEKKPIAKSSKPSNEASSEPKAKKSTKSISPKQVQIKVESDSAIAKSGKIDSAVFTPRPADVAVSPNVADKEQSVFKIESRPSELQAVLRPSVNDTKLQTYSEARQDLGPTQPHDVTVMMPSNIDDTKLQTYSKARQELGPTQPHDVTVMMPSNIDDTKLQTYSESRQELGPTQPHDVTVMMPSNIDDTKLQTYSESRQELGPTQLRDVSVLIPSNEALQIRAKLLSESLYPGLGIYPLKTMAHFICNVQEDVCEAERLKLLSNTIAFKLHPLKSFKASNFPLNTEIEQPPITKSKIETSSVKDESQDGGYFKNVRDMSMQYLKAFGLPVGFKK